MRGKEGKERGELGRAWMGRVERRGERGVGCCSLFLSLFFSLSFPPSNYSNNSI
jgi:hypothetical protein